MTDEELQSSGVAKMLADDVDALRDENATLQDYREKYHEADKKVAVSEEKMKKSTALEVQQTGLVAVGALIAGYAPGEWDSPPTGYVALVVGLLLLLCGIISKAISK